MQPLRRIRHNSLLRVTTMLAVLASLWLAAGAPIYVYG